VCASDLALDQIAIGSDFPTGGMVWAEQPIESIGGAPEEGQSPLSVA